MASSPRAGVEGAVLKRLLWKRIGLGVAFSLCLTLFLADTLRPLVLKAYYRVDYLHLILSASQRYDVSPHLVAAVVFTESRFREEARSEVGAIGLMQLMPSTAAEMAERVGMQDYSPQSLSRPAVNIELGVAYLQYLQRRFADESMMLAAYNAGPTLVETWSSDGRAIPYPETREFVASVRRHKTRLGELYPDWSAAPTQSGSP